MTTFINTENEEFESLTDITFSRKLNGEKSIRGVIYTGDAVIEKIDRGWSMKFQGERYYITYAKPMDGNRSAIVEFDAVHEFFYRMGKSCVYRTMNGSNTAKAYLDFIFNGSGYIYSLAATLPAFEKQNFGMKNRLALFNDFINSTGTEYQINGTTIFIKEKIGSDLSTIVRKGFNMQELGLEHNVGDFVTYAKGFGAYNDPNNPSKGRLEVEYTSPLAHIYGKLEADPVVDERYTQKDHLLRRVKELVEGSYSISVTLAMEDLRQAGYRYGFPEPGDYLLAINESLHFKQKIRIVGVEEEFDSLGHSISHTVTCNSLNLIDKKTQADASNSQSWSDISNGVKPIPNEWLTAAIQQATSDLIDSQTEVKYAKTGILAIDKKDANKIVILNSAGIGVSTNGGKTFENAITAKGVNASAINTGILKAIAIEGVTIIGSTFETRNGLFQTILKGGDLTTYYDGKKFTVLDGNALKIYQDNGINQLGGISRMTDAKTKKQSMSFACERGNYIALSSKGTDGIYYRQLILDGSTGEITVNNLKFDGDINGNNKAIKNIWLTGLKVPNNAPVNFYSSLNMNGYPILNQSDIRLKENIKETTIDGIKETKKLHFVEFERKQNYQSKDPKKQPPKKRELGLLAQYTPFLCEDPFDQEDHYLRLNMNKQVMLNSLTNKQLIQYVETLEQRVLHLEKIVESLEMKK